MLMIHSPTEAENRIVFNRRSLAMLALGAVAAPGPARAQNRNGGPVLVELFTSQGCSSCPPADALMHDLAKDPGLIPLTYSVEIWDYLGWRDTLAKPAFTKRQKAYAAAVAARRVYTPQAIVNGRAHCVGSDNHAIGRLKRSVSPNFGSQRLDISKAGEQWQASVIGSPTGVPPRLLLLPLVDVVSVQIGRGENSGRTIAYANVVRDIVDLGPADIGRRQTISRADLAARDANGFALLLQMGSLEAPGEIIAACQVGKSGVTKA
jgi:hypothetical protein